MYPMMFYIDCNGDLWVPCRCPCATGATGATGGTGTVETAAPKAYQEQIVSQARQDREIAEMNYALFGRAAPV